MDPRSIPVETSDRRKIRINRLMLRDVASALGRGVGDFAADPRYGLFFGSIYALGGLFILYGLVWSSIPWMIIPVAIGFPLIGPFVAVGLYEISRRRQDGLPVTWSGVLKEVFRQRERQFSWMAFVVLFIFWIWIYQVRLLFALFLGYGAPAELNALIAVILTSTQGLLFLSVGTIVGGALATILFSVTVVAMPLLLDHEIDFVTAMITSVRTVIDNPVPMLCFGLVVGMLAVAAMVPAFLGLPVILPILGHATWHLYRMAVRIDM